MKKTIIIVAIIFSLSIAGTVVLFGWHGETIADCQTHCRTSETNFLKCLSECSPDKMKDVALKKLLEEEEECAYEEVVGKAVITEINKATAKPFACVNSPMEVLFDFYPNDESLNNLSTDKDQYLILPNAMDPPLKLIERKKIKVGDAYHGVQQRLVSGDCKPAIYTFFDLDLSDYKVECLGE